MGFHSTFAFAFSGIWDLGSGQGGFGRVCAGIRVLFLVR
jgi:hypothetical protein